MPAGGDAGSGEIARTISITESATINKAFTGWRAAITGDSSRAKVMVGWKNVITDSTTPRITVLAPARARAGKARNNSPAIASKYPVPWCRLLPILLAEHHEPSEIHLGHDRRQEQPRIAEQHVPEECPHCWWNLSLGYAMTGLTSND